MLSLSFPPRAEEIQIFSRVSWSGEQRNGEFLLARSWNLSEAPKSHPVGWLYFMH
jgi:hypothetical protein